MSFMIADILGNTTKRKSSTESKPSKEITLKGVESHANDEENKENVPVPVRSATLCKNTAPVQQERMAKRRLSVSPAPSSCSSERSSSPTDNDGEPRRKKARTSFTNDQIQYLERIYSSQRYLASNNRTDLARMLNLSENQIKTWFQNRRMKEKRQIKGVEERLGGTIAVPAPAVSPHPVLGYPTGTECLGYSPASSPALSPTGVPTMPVLTPGAVFGGVPSIPIEAASLYGQIPTSLAVSSSPLTAHTAAVPFPGQYPGSFLGASPLDYRMGAGPAAVSMTPTPFGHALMGPAIL